MLKHLHWGMFVAQEKGVEAEGVRAIRGQRLPPPGNTEEGPTAHRCLDLHLEGRGGASQAEKGWAGGGTG